MRPNLKSILKRRLLSIIFIAFVLSLSTLSHADIVGKVVGIADGDTITVLQDNTQYKIRLFGIDCPESHQDFGTKAKQYTSEVVFGKTVKVISEDTDRYGRTVGTVTVDGKCLNEEVVKAGYAWVYNQYCKKPICTQWKQYEETARSAKIGLWSHPNPTPPWDFRRGGQTSSETTQTIKKSESTNASASAYHGNVNSYIFHQPGCRHYNCKNCVSVFDSRAKAIEAGYRPCKICKP